MERQFRVLVNDEEQYGLLPVACAIPPGWSDTGCSGSERECVSYVDAHWTDLRPRSLRVALGEA